MGPMLSNHFFRQQIRQTPSINAAYWSFTLRGLVDLPLFLSYNDLLAMPSVETLCTIACIGSPADASLIGNAVWQGVTFQTLLDELTVQPATRYANFFATDGYATSIPFDKLPGALLVYGMNGEMLPQEHGFPARLIVPGLYGYKMPKWIQRVELAADPVIGVWEKRGWSAVGEVQTTSAILSPRHLETMSGAITFSGIAYAGNRPITNVEISIDDGPWMPVPFQQEDRGHWAQWSIDWRPYMPGDYGVRVRATDGTGFTQPGETPIFPNGSTTIHSIIVRATG
jgi:Oxidoreductase molybdopterin binding domain/Mo-co oxidoreductase dimerisation domain